MKNFKDYCNEELDFVTMNKNQKSDILDKCIVKSTMKSIIIKNFSSKYYLNKIAISCLCIVVSIFGIKYYVNTNKLDNHTIIFPTENSKLVCENKIKLPDGKETEWTYEEVCTYFGKNIELSKVPENLKISTLKDPKIVYINENNEVTFDNIEVTYQEKKVLESGAYINILMSKDKMPIVDEIFVGDTNSFISGVNVNIYKLGVNNYRIEFMYDDIGYIITTSLIEQNAITDILKSIIK
nr:hypothetical protein [uncultured Lachnoclostridium sp.]